MSRCCFVNAVFSLKYANYCTGICGTWSKHSQLLQWRLRVCSSDSPLGNVYQDEYGILDCTRGKSSLRSARQGIFTRLILIRHDLFKYWFSEKRINLNRQAMMIKKKKVCISYRSCCNYELLLVIYNFPLKSSQWLKPRDLSIRLSLVSLSFWSQVCLQTWGQTHGSYGPNKDYYYDIQFVSSGLVYS